MKIPSQFVKQFRSLKSRIQRNVPISKTQKKDTLPEDPIEMLILGVIMEFTSLSEAKSILRRLKENTVDFNELRVTSLSEFNDLLKSKIKEPAVFGKTLTKTLNAVMDEFDTLDLSFLDTLPKIEVRKRFGNIRDQAASAHSIDFFLMMRFDISTVPLSEKMLDFLKQCEAIPKELDLSATKAFIERQLRASEMKNFYWQLRKASELPISKFKPKPQRRTKKKSIVVKKKTQTKKKTISKKIKKTSSKKSTIKKKT